MAHTLSSDFVILRERFDKIIEGLPPISVSGMTQLQRDKIAASIIFISAACEKYLEDRCEGLADNSVLSFTSTGNLNRVAMYLMLSPIIKIPPDLNKSEKTYLVYATSSFKLKLSPSFITANHAIIVDALSKGLRHYKSDVIKKNHGIAPKHLAGMLGTIGVGIDWLSPTLTSRLIQVWSFRGEAAHTSVIQANVHPDPSVVESMITDLKSEFKRIDRKLTTVGTVPC